MRRQEGMDRGRVILYTCRQLTGNLLLLYYLLLSAILGLKGAVSLNASDKLLNMPACQEYSKFKHNYLSVLEHQSLIHKLRQLLHGQHIVFIGDSLTRYFYISLVYALKYNRFNNDTIVPNIVKEEEWGTYNYFYGNSTKLLGPNEHCDCYRGKLNSPYNFENRYFNDDIHSFNLTYYQYWGRDIHGHWQDHGDYDILRTPQSRPLTAFWSHKNIIEFFNSSIIPLLKIKPTIIVLSAGIWVPADDTEYFTPDHLNAIMSSAFRIVPRVIYKTTPYRKHDRDDFVNSPNNYTFPYKAREDLACGIQGVECFNLSWTRCVINNSYVDWYHFKADIYTHMIGQFFHILSNHTL